MKMNPSMVEETRQALLKGKAATWSKSSNLKIAELYNGQISSYLPDSAVGFTHNLPKKPVLEVPSRLPHKQVTIDREIPPMYSKRNKHVDGNLIPITERAYNTIMEQGTVLKETTKKIPKNSMIINHYATGGPTTPNYQTLGNIKFDSNTVRKAPEGYLIARDEKTGKDFGVVRNNDGTYR